MKAVWRMLQRDVPDDFLIATGKTHSLCDLVAAIFACCGLNAVEHVVFDATLLRPLERSESRLNPTKAEQQVGWRARTKMKDMAALLVACERDRSLRPLPWILGGT